MRWAHRLQAYAGLAVLEFGDKAEVLALRLDSLAFLLEHGVVALHLLPEVVQRALEEVVRDEEVLLHIVLLHTDTRLTGQDDQLTDHVLTAQVDTRVRLGETRLHRHADGLAQRNILADRVEDEVQRTGKDSLQLHDPIATEDQVVDRIDDWKTGAPVGLVQVLDATLAGDVLQLHVVVIIT